MANTSAVRNTCFAILSAIEVDLRELIEGEVAPSGGEAFLPTDVQSNAAARFAYDHKDIPYAVEAKDVDLLAYMDFGDIAKVLRPAESALINAYGPGITTLASSIEQFAPTRNRVCHSRPLEVEDFPACLDFAKMLLNSYCKMPWTLLRETQKQISENPGYVVALQIPEYWQLGSTPIRHNLPLPDYDETGFLGRVADRSAVRKHLLASHPVITIVGEGGVGKSALAIHCLYDLLNIEENPPYEAIIWTSLKTKTLTALGVSNIKDSITSTLGIIQNVAKELGAGLPDNTNIGDAIEEIIEYMRLFRILLVVDNFETMSDSSLRPLLTSIPSGSKVLLTSRVGLGELEIRYKLDPLDMKTSVSLLRRYSKALNVEVLFAANNNRLERYCQHLYFNPLLIKWFAQGVSLGSDPEKLISKGSIAFDEVLKYCFDNLFSRLDKEECRVLQLLAAARRPLSHTELLFLMQNISQIEPIKLDQALSTLHSSSMLKRSSLGGKNREGAIQLCLTDVSSDYIARFAPPDKNIFEKIQQASRKLNQQIQQSSVRQAAYKFDLQAVRTSTRDQIIAAFHLNSALELSRSGDYAGARKSVSAAKELLPTFAEAFRIGSLVESRAEELYKASQEIEEAAQLDPESALIHYQFANFLTNKLEDYERALSECNAAIKYDPKEGALLTLKALILTRLGKYSEAAPLYDSVLCELAGRPKKWRISTRDQAAECYRRFSEQDRSMKNGDEFRQHIDRSCTILEEAMAANDYDLSTGRLYSNVIEDALFFAIKEMDELFGISLFQRLSDASHLLSIPSFTRLTPDRFETVFGADSRLAITAKEFASRLDKKLSTPCLS